MSRMDAFDQRYYLIGDENCGVGIACRICYDSTGIVAYYDATGQQYGSDVPSVTSISALFAAALAHEGCSLDGEKFVEEVCRKQAPTVHVVTLTGTMWNDAELADVIRRQMGRGTP